MIDNNALATNKSEPSVNDVEKVMKSCARDNKAALYHLKSGGSRTRATICLRACHALQIPAQDAVALASCIELMHNASLIHDDLQDKDPIRRERDAVWKKFGADIAICAGDWLIVKAFGELAKVTSPAKLPALITQVQEAVSTTIHGQCGDIQQNCLTLADYEEVAAAKSGPLIRIAVELPLLLIEDETAIETASNAITRFAVAYQIADDLTDWKTDREDGRLNIVNVLSRSATAKQAFHIAQGRAQYLLKSCQLELATLPRNCGAVVIDAAQQLYVKVSQATYE